MTELRFYIKHKLSTVCIAEFENDETCKTFISKMMTDEQHFVRVGDIIINKGEIKYVKIKQR